MTAPMAGPGLLPPLRHPAARVLLAAFVVLHTALAIASSGATPPVLLALLLLSGAVAAIVLLPRLSMGATAASITAALSAVALTVLPLPSQGWPGYSAWALGGTTFCALALTLRERIGAAWLLLSATAALCVAWSSFHGTGPLPGLNLEVRHAGTLLLGTLFAVGLRRAARAIDALQRASRAQQVALAVSTSTGTELQRVADRFLELSGSALRALAQSGPTPSERPELLALEGRLRDEITASALLTDDLSQAVAAARRRGVDVVLLAPPEGGALSPAQARAIARWLAPRVERAESGTFVARLSRRTDGLRVSAHTPSSDEVLELPD